MSETPRSSGVQELIDRLRQDGVSAGREQADALVEQARSEAREIRDEAEAEAERIRQAAREEAESLQRATREALDLAYRDTVLCLKEALTRDFRSRLEGLVAETLGDPELLRGLVLEVAGRALPDDIRGHDLEIELPEQAVALDELRRDPESARNDPLSGLVVDLAAEQLRDGVTITHACGRRAGLVLRLTDADVEVDLSDTAVAEQILQHLVPRFRALLDGIVR